MYRGRLWTMRQFSGFATPEETNQRYLYLLSQGQTGLSVAFDLPTLMGFDADHPALEGEVGKCGVSISSLADMEILFRQIPLDKVTVSMTINSSAPVIWAMYLALAEKQRASWTNLSGTLQNDILKEYIAQKEYIYPPRPSMRLVTDVIEYSTQHVPRFNPISISGYHIREAGSTAVQELAFTLRDGIEYVEWAIERGLPVDSFAPRLSFFFNAHSDFFEEIAKFRAARTIWAEVLGGTQSLHTNSLDEAYALPSQEAATIALRTQQIIAHESGVPAVADPLGGSYLVENLTQEIMNRANQYIRRIDEMGGMIPAIERGYPQTEIANASYEYQRAVETGAQKIVGVNAFYTDHKEPIQLLQIDDSPAKTQRERLAKVRSERDAAKVTEAIDALKRCAESDQNTIPFILDAVRAYATVGEICDAFREVFGTYTEKSIF